MPKIEMYIHRCILRKEKASVANDLARNNKSKLSAINPIANKRMGHRIDTIYSGGGTEVGGLEIGKNNDDTKEFKDNMFKLSLVLRQPSPLAPLSARNSSSSATKF